MPAFAAERPALLDAAKNADADAVRVLVQKKVDVNAADADGTTALHWASYRDDVASADLLIRAGARVDAATDLGVTPLWNASLNGSEAMVARLLKAGANPNAALLLGETPVMAAARSGYPAVVEQLIAKGANVNARGARGQTALMWAVSQKHSDVVKVLLARGADVHVQSEVWNEVMAVPPHGHLDYNRAIPHGGDTALMFAARAGDLESAARLVAAGAHVNDADAWGVSATALAAHAGYRDLVVFLLDHGADPNAARAGFTALHAAVMRRDEAMAAALLAHGADPNFRVTSWTPTRRSSKDYHFSPELVGATPFWLAARFDSPSLMQLLLKHGADPWFVHRGDHVVEARGGSGFQRRTDVTTALMAAVGMGGGEAWIQPERSEREPLALEAAKMLVELGIDVNAANLDGRTALDAAKAAKYETVARFLVDNGARTGTK
ncbi:MAG TPA: ankyrin repeat domain-containing protein [Vicinamibacterales bacterium]|nr:ankyrin repeat domain-containing protein [Vicinamibacterales bacterium]